MAEYIEREKAYEAVLFATCGSGYQYEATCAIDLMPAADVAPVVHGHWKHVAGMNSKCSVCERYFPVNEFVKRPFDINYCPNCGAKMDGEG